MPDTSRIGSKPLSVSAAMALAKGALEGVVVTLIGEVSEVSNKPGYKAVYFSVKDENATMPCMMWMNKYHSAGVNLTVGALVQLTGRFTLYAPKGRMNFDVFSLSLAGEGTLRQRVAQIAQRLKSEGLMDQARKRALPDMPHTIGIVTSPRGAAVHDVLRTLRRRWPQAQVLLAGVPVEGENAPAALIEGLATVAEGGAQVILLVRGGGSFEDLMPFNDEALARAIASCPVPVVTGIGHEPDTSIADMVADKRASTPTAAAEAVSPDIAELDVQTTQMHARLHKSIQTSLQHYDMLFEHRAHRPVFVDPQQLFATDAQTLDYTEERLHRSIPAGIKRDASTLSLLQTRLERLLATELTPYRNSVKTFEQRSSQIGLSFVQPWQTQMHLSASRLEDLSPLAILTRGYGMVRDAEGGVVTSATQALAGSDITVTLKDGSLSCTVNDVTPGNIALIEWKDEDNDH